MNKLEQALAQLNTDKQVLDGLRSERAKLAIQNSAKNAPKIAVLDKQIVALRDKIENSPTEIELLEEQLATEQQAQQQQERETLLSEQKIIADEIIKLSKTFVQTLRKSESTNNKLREAWNEYKRLRTLTGEELLSPKVCEPSEGMLKYLLSTLEQELEQGKHCRMMLHPLCPLV